MLTLILKNCEVQRRHTMREGIETVTLVLRNQQIENTIGRMSQAVSRTKSSVAVFQKTQLCLLTWGFRGPVTIQKKFNLTWEG